MPHFAYTASSDEGNILNGVVEAANEDAAIDAVRHKGLYVIEVTGGAEAARAAASSGIRGAAFSFGSRVSRSDLLGFTREFSHLLAAQLPLDRCLDMVLEMTDRKAFARVLQTIRDDVRGGSSLSEALEKHKKVFPPIYTNMTRAGEASGELEGTMANLLEFLEDENELISTLKSSMTYPILLGVMGVGVVVLLMVKIIPSFDEMLSEMGKALPAPTQALITMSDFLTRRWWAILAGLGAAGALAWSYVQTPSGKMAFDSLKLNAPVFGDLARKIAAARFCRILGILVKNEVPILDSMKIVRQILNNEVLSRAIGAAHDRVKEGESLAVPLQESGAFPRMATRLIAIGEETGQLEDMLLKAASIFDLQAKTRIKQLVTLIEPLMMTLMAAFVGFIVMAMLSAILSISDF